MRWIFLFTLIGCGVREPAQELSLVIQLPAGISQNGVRKGRFLKRVRYLQIRVGQGEAVQFPPEQWEKLPLGDLPVGERVEVRASVWDLDRYGKARNYAVMNGEVVVNLLEVNGPVLLKLSSKISVRDYD